ncbi:MULTISPECIES: hypothetical protein [Paenibacillus]|jgi:hypothetical protein|nr:MULTISPECIES: hypothetical protein [Paenibacillus]
MRKTSTPLRVRIVSPIAVKPGKLRLTRGGGFPALKGDRCRFSDTIPAPPLYASQHSAPTVMPWGRNRKNKKTRALVAS